MRIFCLIVVCFLSIAYGQDPANWRACEPVLLPDASMDQDLEDSIDIIGREDFQATLQIAQTQVDTMYSIIGIKRTARAEQPSLQLRTLWHDLTRLYYCMGLNQATCAAFYKIDIATITADMIPDARLAMRQIGEGDKGRIPELCRVIGIQMPDIPTIK